MDANDVVFADFKAEENMQSFVIQPSSNGVWYGTFPAFSAAGFVHGVSTRLGGESVEPFFSLNLGLHTGDDRGTVIRNRQRFAKAVGIEFSNVVTAQQVHGNGIAVIDQKQAGRGNVDYQDSISGVDSLITNCRGLPLMLFFADCVPVLIADPVRGVVGISHAGWKGTVFKIALQTVQKMSEYYHTSPSDCLAAIGPSIGPCCYEVDQQVLVQFQANFSQWESFVTQQENNRWNLNLWEANRYQLIEAGISPKKIYNSHVCTACNESLFFSYRKEKGLTGRMGVVIQLL